MLKARQNRKHYGTIRTLLLNCVKLLDQERHPQVRGNSKLQLDRDRKDLEEEEMMSNKSPGLDLNPDHIYLKTELPGKMINKNRKRILL